MSTALSFGIWRSSVRCIAALRLDWCWHEESGPLRDDFGIEDLVENELAVIKASEADKVVPFALSHAGWVAIELQSRLGE